MLRASGAEAVAELPTDSPRPTPAGTPKETEHGCLEVIPRTEGRKVDIVLAWVRSVPTRMAHVEK